MIWELVLKNAWKSKIIFLVQLIFAFRDRAEFEKKSVDKDVIDLRYKHY